MRPDKYIQFDKELLERTLNDELHFPIAITEQIPPEKLGFHSHVFLGVYKGEEVVIKLGDTSGSQPYSVQVAISNFLHEHGLPVPRILFAADSTTQLNQPIIIESKVEGQSFRDGEISSPAMESAGTILEKINSIPIDGFGRIIVKNGKLAGELDCWKDFFSKYHRHNEYALENGFIGKSEFGHVGKLIDEFSNQHVSQGYFLHGDYHGAHIFSKNDAVTGVIDYGHALSGDPRYDIAYAHFFLSPEQREYFNRGYGEQSTDEEVRKYLTLIAIQKVKTRHSRGSKGLKSAQKVLSEVFQEQNI